METEALIDALEDAGYGEDRDEILLGYDMNGPIASTDSADISFHDGVPEALRQVDAEHQTAIISGHPIHTLEMMLDQAGCERFHTVGELGAAYDAGDGIQNTQDGDPDALDRLYHDIFDQAAREHRKLLIQPNRSTTVASFKFEGEGRDGDPRADIYERSDVDAELSTDDIWDELREVESTDYDGDVITFDSDPATAGAVADRLTAAFSYPGIRFQHHGDRIGIRRDRYDDPGATVEDGWAFIERAVNGDWVPDHNDDWGSDVIYETADPSKEHGTRSLIEYGIGDDPDDYVIVHMGDKQSDVMTGDNTIFIAQEDSPAEQYCEQNDIEYLTARDAADYTEAAEAALRRLG